MLFLHLSGLYFSNNVEQHYNYASDPQLWQQEISSPAHLKAQRGDEAAW